MRDGMRRSAGLALLLGILCAPPARAEDQPLSEGAAPASRAWSDPPTKPAEVRRADAPSPGPGMAEPAGPTSAASRSPTARIAATPARATPRLRRAERRTIARRTAETRQVARTSRRGLGEAPPSRATALRAPLVRVARPMPPEGRGGLTPSMPPEGRGGVAGPLPPEMRGDRDVDLWIDARADRIRRARDGGFLVMRRSTVEDSMGRRMQILRPLDDEDE